MAIESNKVLDRLRGLCSRREYCSSEVMKKALDALDGDREAASGIVETLKREKYIDDLRYASAFARDKSSISGWGAVKIRYMLSGKGISGETVSAALEEIDADKASDRLAGILENKARSLKGDPQIRMKLIRFALGRGYEYEEINRIVEKLTRI